MLTLTTPDGHTITAATDVELAAKWLDTQHGDGWDNQLAPFDEHDAMYSALEDIALMAEGTFTGYRVTKSHPFDR